MGGDLFGPGSGHMFSLVTEGAPHHKQTFANKDESCSYENTIGLFCLGECWAWTGSNLKHFVNIRVERI